MFSSIFKFITRVVGPATVLLIAFSVIHEWGYFSIVGYKFQSIVSATDYVTNAILWLPYSFFGLLYFVENGPAPKGGESRWARLGTYLLLLLNIGGIIYASAVLPLSSYGLTFIAMWIATFWFLLVNRFFVELKIEITKTAYNLIRTTPALMVGVYFWGMHEGMRELKHPDSAYWVQRSEANSKKPIALMRVFDRGILVRDPNSQTVEFIRWEKITSLEKFSPPDSEKSATCVWLNIWCPKPSIP